MTDDAGPTTPETPGGDRGDERLARDEERAQLGVEPPTAPDDDDSGEPGTVAALADDPDAVSADAGPVPATSGVAATGGVAATDGVPATDGTSPGSGWPAVTVMLLTVAAWVPVVLTFLRAGIDPDPFAFRTDNVFWVLAIVGAPATMTLVAGASGLHPRAAGAGALRIAAASVAGAQLFVLAVIAVIQVLWEARAAIMAQTAYTVVALLLAAGAVTLALATARAHRRGAVTAFWQQAPVVGLVGVLLGQTVLAVGRTAQFPGEFDIYFVSLLISTLTATATLTGLWLVGRGHPTAGWTGAAMLCLMAVLWLGSMINVTMAVDLPLPHRVTEIVQYLLYAVGAVTAVLAARAGARAAARLRSTTP